MSLRPLIPMLSITGRPAKELLRERLDEYVRVGVEQFLIYPRSGLELEYMGEEWLDACAHIVDYAAGRDMAVWLYDEFNWPSGKCGGQVVKADPSFAAKKLCAFCEPGVTPLKRSYSWGEVQIPIYADLLNPQAVDLFISLTHERYAKRFGKSFGTTVKGIFTDEPSFAYAKFHPVQGALLELPYYSGLEGDYRELSSRDFRKDLESHLDGRTPEGLWRDFSLLLGRRFRSSFFDKIRAWCDSHGLLFTGHLMEEVSPKSSISFSGDPMKAMASLSLPGIDEIFTHVAPSHIEWVTLKMIESRSSAIGNGALAELFALGPSDMPLSKLRQMLWLSALHGVDHYVTAVSALDARANIEKSEYFNPISYSQPWFPFLKELGDDASLAAVFARKPASFKIAVRYPQSLASRPSYKPLSEDFALSSVLRFLADAQWQALLIEEEEAPNPSFVAVLSLQESSIFDERSGSSFASLGDLLAFLERNFVRDLRVEEFDGSLAEGLLVKSFSDGAFAVLSLGEATERKLRAKREGLPPLELSLPSRGVFTSETAFGIGADASLELADGPCEFALSSGAFMRCHFDSSARCEFDVDAELDGVRALLRDYGPKAETLLDGWPLRGVSAARSLPLGLRELYMETEPLKLSPGRHSLALSPSLPDTPYLPLCFLSGSFSMKEDGRLARLPALLGLRSFRKDGLRDFAGRISFKFRMDLRGVEALTLSGFELACELFAGELSLGRRAWAPFAWRVPESLRRDGVELRLDVYTSIGPLFGTCPGDKDSCLGRFWPS